MWKLGLVSLTSGEVGKFSAEQRTMVENLSSFEESRLK